MVEKELFRFGVIADIQYADVEDCYSHDKTTLRKYRGSLDNLKQAVLNFNEKLLTLDDDDVNSFIIQLGDIIDGSNSGNSPRSNIRERVSDEALGTVLSVFKSLRPGIKIYHSIGNHELYNYSWNELETKLNFNNNQVSENGRFYFSFKPCDSWRLIHLNSYELSLCQDTELEGYKIAASMMRKENPNYPEFKHFFRGVAWKKQHFSPLNGGVSQTQLLWMDGELRKAQNNGENVIVTAHIPLSTRSSNRKTKILNAEEILKIFKKYPGVVKLFLCGHCHEGGYFYDKNMKLAHVTVPSALNYENSFGIIAVTKNKITIQGTGGLKSRIIIL